MYMIAHLLEEAQIFPDLAQSLLNDLLYNNSGNSKILRIIVIALFHHEIGNSVAIYLLVDFFLPISSLFSTIVE